MFSWAACNPGALSLSSGDPVPDWKRLAEEHQRRHRSIPLQGRRPQQNSHWRLPWREVRIKIVFLFSFLRISHPPSIIRYILIHQHSSMWLIKASKSKRIFSVLLHFLLVKHTPIFSQTQFISSTFRPSCQDIACCSIGSCLWLSYSFISNCENTTRECVCFWKAIKSFHSRASM